MIASLLSGVINSIKASLPPFHKSGSKRGNTTSRDRLRRRGVLTSAIGGRRRATILQSLGGTRVVPPVAPAPLSPLYSRQKPLSTLNRRARAEATRLFKVAEEKIGARSNGAYRRPRDSRMRKDVIMREIRQQGQGAPPVRCGSVPITWRRSVHHAANFIASRRNWSEVPRSASSGDTPAGRRGRRAGYPLPVLSLVESVIQ
jgi:hypothetical protein